MKFIANIKPENLDDFFSARTTWVVTLGAPKGENNSIQRRLVHEGYIGLYSCDEQPKLTEDTQNIMTDGYA